jgi:hypothetical protein
MKIAPFGGVHVFALAAVQGGSEDGTAAGHIDLAQGAAAEGTKKGTQTVFARPSLYPAALSKRERKRDWRHFVFGRVGCRVGLLPIQVRSHGDGVRNRRGCPIYACPGG